MRFIGTPEVRTDSFGKLLGRKHPVGFDDMALAVDPFGFNGIEPRTLRGQEEGQDADPLVRLLDLLIVGAYPSAHRLALVPRGIIPDQEPMGLPLLAQPFTAPVQELDGDGTHGSSRDKTQPHLGAVGSFGRALLPQDPVAGQGLGIGVVFAPSLLDQPYRLIRALPGMGRREGKATPPDFIQKADGPGGLPTGPGN